MIVKARENGVLAWLAENITESQKHRVAEVGRDLWKSHLVRPPPLAGTPRTMSIQKFLFRLLAFLSKKTVSRKEKVSS